MAKIKIRIVDFMKSETESKRKLHPAGYLILPDCQIARSGILQYGDVMCDDGVIINDGEVINVYRPPEALRECIKQFNNIPLSIQHPKESAVDPETVRDVIVGTIGSNARIVKLNDGEVAVVADIMVHDKEAIDIIQNNKMTELSAGYETAYRKQRGTTKGGNAYEAIQYYLMPNHVALVEEGRCGSECKVCDNGISNKEKIMRIKRSQKKSDKKYRYFLPAGDSKDGVIEISKQVFDELAKQEDAEIEELKEDEVELQENEKPEEKLNPEDENLEGTTEDKKKTDEEESGEESEEDEEKETAENEESMNDEDEDLEKKEDEDISSDEIFEVELDDGTIGKMDKVAYEYMKRFVDMQKKGDSMTPAEIMKLSAIGERTLGSKFAIDSYVTADGKFNQRKLKQDIIKANMPGVVVKSLKNDEALNSMFDCAIKTSTAKKTDWAKDMIQLGQKPNATDSSELGLVEKARLLRLNKINGKENK